MATLASATDQVPAAGTSGNPADSSPSGRPRDDGPDADPLAGGWWSPFPPAAPARVAQADPAAAGGHEASPPSVGAAVGALSAGAPGDRSAPPPLASRSSASANDLAALAATSGGLPSGRGVLRKRGRLGRHSPAPAAPRAGAAPAAPLGPLVGTPAAPPSDSPAPSDAGAGSSTTATSAAGSGSTTSTALTPLRPRPVPGLLAVGPDAGGPPEVRLFDAATREERLRFLAADRRFTGGVRVAVGDVNGDGSPDVLTGFGPGGGSLVRVFDGRTGRPFNGTLGGFAAFGPGQTDGTFVALGDFNADGRDDLVVGTDGAAAPSARVFSGLDGSPLADYALPALGRSGGARVAAGDVNGVGLADLIAAAGPGQRPRVLVHDGSTGAVLYDFFAYEDSFFGGVSVAAGDLTGGGRADILTGPGPGRAPEVRAFHGADTAYLAKFLAYDPSFTGGVRVAAAPTRAGGPADILTAQGPDGGQVRFFDGRTHAPLAGLTPYGARFDDGLFVGGPTPAPAGGQLSILSTTITVVNGTPAAEPSNSSEFLFDRAGDTEGSLTVSFTITGTATNGVDYNTIPGSVTFGPGQDMASLVVAPLDDSVFEGTETIVLTLQPGSGYNLSTIGTTATVLLEDDELDPNAMTPPADVPEKDCRCDGTRGELLKENSGVRNKGPSAFSENPVRYSDGVVRVASSELGSEGFGVAWGQTLSWTNGPGYASGAGGNGNGWVVSQLPYLMQDEGTVIAVSNGTTARYFDPDGSGGYTPRHFLQEQLSYDSGTGTFRLTDTTGQVLTFHDFDTGLPAAQRGQLLSLTDPEGNVTEVVDRTTDGKPEELQRQSTVGGTTVTESYLYTYLTSGANAGKVSNVTLRRKVNSGSWVTVRQADYTYYGTSESFGNVGDLKTEVVKDGAGTTLDTRYYRYYTSNSSTGYTGGLKFVFNHESFGRLAAAFVDPLTATDAQVDDYADLYLEYDALKRVSKEVVQGAGCSACTGGLGTYAFAYGTSGFADGYNSWRRKAVETLPDGNEKVVFTNFAGQVMLELFRETATGNEWLTFYKYDGDGRLLWVAQPSAVSGYDEARPDLLNNQSGNYQYLRDSAGLIQTTSYYASTTATSSTPGGVAGYVYQTAIQRGETGSSVLQSTTDYIARTGGGATVYPVADQTRYRNVDGTGGQTTSYSYTWFSGSTQMESVTTTLPTVTTGQNGPGTAVSEAVYFDAYGRQVWRKDGDGFLSYTDYDQKTGAVTKVITDVDTSQTSDFTGLPSGWSAPTGGGLHLITTMEVDDLGRVTKRTEPNGHVTYTVYNDSSHEVRTYRGWNTSTNAPTGPTEVYREDRAGSYTERLTMSATPAVSNGRPTGTESISGIQALSRTYTNAAGQVTHADAYFNLSGLTYSTSTSLGTENTHFSRTRYGYQNPRGWRDRVELPTGTIQRTAYDSLGRVVSTWVGLDDTPTSGLWSPSNTAGTDLVKVSEKVYDGGGVGDGNLTQVTQAPGGSAANRVTQFFYDWRNRQVAGKAGVQGTEGTDTQRPIAYTEYDNLGQAVAQEQYDGDNVTISDANSDGLPDKPSSSLLRARSTTAYDELGRAYQQKTFSVDQSTGSVSTSALTTDTWYDKRGEVIKTAQPGGLVEKQKYDGAGRVTKSYATDGGGDSGWSDAGTVTGDAVLSQSETQYDASGLTLLVTVRDRFHDETATGELDNATTAPKARVSYTASYYDLADRLTDTVNVGTNGGSAYTRPSSVPSRSDTVLVTSTAYNAAGWADSTTDPRGIITKNTYDALGRTTKTVEDYTDGTPTDSSNKTTEFTYDGSGHTLTVKGVLPGGAYETTEYVYGVTTSAGSDFNSNDILSAIKYPDKSTGDPSNSEKESYTVNALGEWKTKTDRSGSVHGYGYDVVGRMTADAVSALGSGVDGAVRRLQTAYDTAGRPYLYTSYDAVVGGNVVNQVQQAYNGLGQLTAEYQSHSGAVNTSTTPKVQYAYSEMASGANHSRLTSITYPNGKVLSYNYGSGLDNSVSRLTSLSDSSGTLESYSYLGLDTVVVRAHPQPGVDLTYVKQTGESTGDAGDQYTGLDRFGRVVDQRWRKTSDGSHTDRFVYGYDRDSNRLYRDNLVNSSFGELYHANGASNGYDQLNQLTDFRRGTLSDANSDGVPETVTTASRSQSWDFDALGNWDSVTTDGTTQSRGANQQNQVTSITGLTTPGYDANGNTTTDQAGNTLTYDAWNRLLKVSSGGATLTTYSVDARGRRVVENPGTARDLYYSANWQVVEERESGVIRVQAMWSPVYVDALVLRERDADGLSGNGLEERLYVQQEANWNVTALLDT